jgi:uncharacterized protein (TIGR03437 family)
VVPYVIGEELPNPNRVTEAIEHWNQNTPIKLVARTDQPNYVKFTKPLSPGICSSFVGMIGREQAINLADSCTAGNTIHEIGHAVGLHHEQARQDRDLFIRTRLDNADKRSLANFNQQLVEADDIGPYDHTSIMHYDVLGFSRNGLAVLETMPAGIPINQREKLSPGDIAAVKKMYGWPIEEVTISTNPFGLEIVVDGEKHTSPKSFRWEPGSKHTIGVNRAYDQDGYRYLLAGWNDGGEQEHTITAAPDMPVYSANFVRYGLLSVSGSANGSVSVNPPSQDGYYPEGSMIEIQATAARDDLRFREWTGFVFANSIGQNPVRIMMRAPSLIYNANFTAAPVTTITSEPPGLRVVVDGATITTPRSYAWTPDSTHEIKVEAASQNGGLDTYRNVFQGWSDEGEQTHTITAGTGSQVFTARFQTQHLVARSTVTGGQLQFSPALTDGFYDAGTALSIVPTGSGNNRFIQWSGDLAGSDAPGQFVVDDHKLVGATFQSPRTISSIVNAATQVNTGAVAPGQLVAINGLEIGPEDRDVSAVRVTFDQFAAVVVSSNRDKLVVVVPQEIAGREQVVVNVSTRGSASGSRGMLVAPAIPGVFTVDESGKGQARAWNEDGSENSAGNPAAKGSVVLVQATVTLSGEPLKALAGGRNAVVESTRSESPGQVYVRLRLPVECPSGALPVVLRVGNISSIGSAYVSVR